MRLWRFRNSNIPWNDPNGASDATFNGKQVTPTFYAMMAIEMKNPVGEKSGKNICRDVWGPEASKTGGQFPIFIEIAQIEDDLFKSAFA